MSRSLTHIGSGPHYGRGKKHIIRARRTRAQVAATLGFLIAVVLIVTLGMYLGWLTAQEEEHEQTNSPETEFLPSP
jgi:hypothetical protein